MRADIIIEDTPEGGVTLRVEFDPPLMPGIPPSPAQSAAYEVARAISGSEGVPSDEEDKSNG